MQLALMVYRPLQSSSPKTPAPDRELLFQELTGLPNIVPILDTGEWGSFWGLGDAKGGKVA